MLDFWASSVMYESCGPMISASSFSEVRGGVSGLTGDPHWGYWDGLLVVYVGLFWTFDGDVTWVFVDPSGNCGLARPVDGRSRSPGMATRSSSWL